MIQGKVYSVARQKAGGEVLVDAPTGSTGITLLDASDFDESGGQVSINDEVYTYTHVDMDEDVVTLASGLTAPVVEGDMLFLEPVAEYMVAIVNLDDQNPIEARLSQSMNLTLAEGERLEEEAETVTLIQEGGVYVVTDVVGRPAVIDADNVYITNLNQALVDDQTSLGESLLENHTAIADAQDRLAQAQSDLAAAQARLTTAEGELDALGDDLGTNSQAIADAQDEIAQAKTDIATAKQEALDAAEAAGLSAVQQADANLATARAELESAISSGNSDAIADAEAKIAIAKQEAIDAAYDDATAKMAEVMTKANSALTAAQSAQATADNAIRTYYAPTPPWADNTEQPEEVLGDMWYDDNTGQAYRWNGTTWIVIVDQTIGQALSAAQNAQSTADGKITAFYQNSEPIEADPGDLWFDTDDNSKVYYRTTTGGWKIASNPKQLADDAKAAAIADAQIKANAAKQEAITAANNHTDTKVFGSTQIADDAITTPKIATNAIVADSISAGAIGAVAIAAGAVEADKIAANAIYGDKLLIARSGNLIVDPDFTVSALTTKRIANSYNPWEVVTESGAKFLRYTRTGSGPNLALTNYGDLDQSVTPVEPGMKYKVALQVRANAAVTVSLSPELIWWDSAGASDTQAAVAAAEKTLVANEWTTLYTTIVAPDNAVKGGVVWWGRASDDARFDVRSPVMSSMTGATHIEDGAIITSKLGAEAVTADKLLVDTALANKINANIANIVQANIENLTVTGDTHLNNLVAQRIAGDTAEFISLTVDQLTATGTSTLNSVVAQTIATEIADIVQANIGNLTVTGDAHLNNVVAERIGADVGSYVNLTVDQLLAGNLDVVMNIGVGGMLRAGDPEGTAVELDPDGIIIHDVDDDGVRYASTSIGGSGVDTFWITDSSGERVAGFAEDGNVVGSSGAFANDISISGTPLLGTLAGDGSSSLDSGWLDQLPWGVISRQNFSAFQGPRDTAQEWGYASIGATMIPGRLYRLGATVQTRSGATGGVVRCRLRLSTDGTPVSITSPVETQFEVSNPNTYVYHTAHLEGFSGVASTSDVQMLVTYEGINGGVPRVSGAELWIEDVGPSGSYGGGSYNTGGQTSGGGGGETPTPTVRTYTSTWRASDSGTYTGSGARRTASAASGDVIQGYNSYNGNQKGIWYFGNSAVAGETSKTMGAALAGATVKKVEMYVYANHTYFGSGGTVNMRRASGFGIPSTWGAVNLTGNSKSFSIKSGQGRWVTVDNVWTEARLFTVSTGSNSGANYVRLNGHTDSPTWTRPAIRVTYER